VIPYARKAGAVLLLAALVATHWTAYRQGGATERADHADTRAAHAQQLQRIADKTTAAAGAAFLAQQAHQRAVAAIDTERTQERDHANQDNDRLRAAVRTGTVRLRIAATCPARSSDGGDVPSVPATSGVDAEAAVLTPEAGQAAVNLRAALIAERAQLLALQDYARACGGVAVRH
jgi:prophage endopeptidase